jgi:hypothetical protein
MHMVWRVVRSLMQSANAIDTAHLLRTRDKRPRSRRAA